MVHINAVETAEKKYPRVRGVYSAFDAKYDRDFSFAGEKHDFWEAVCVFGGRAVITADSLVCGVDAGNVIFHKPMKFHKIAADGDGLEVVIFSFCVDGDMTCFENGIFKISHKARTLAENIPALFRRCTDDGAAHMLINSVERFLLELRTGERLLPSSDKTPGAAEFKRIVDTMEAHLGEKLSVGELSELCRLSCSNMKKIFFRYTGTGIMKYFNGMKIERAAELLREGKSIIEVSDSLGFDNQNYFSTVFKREMGICPSAYKKS